ncbi:MAG: CotH kinase family protein [Phycisphaerae bacterium]|nr:CotH kinase family protein [Phycisphaerae bacterium]
MLRVVVSILLTTAFFARGAFADDLFEGAIPTLRIVLTEAASQSLREDARRYVGATLTDGETAYADVAVRLKGSAGSFRDLDDRPAFTVHMRRFAGREARDRDWRGLIKFHLNNSVQDESLLHEAIAYDVFRVAGIAAPRVGHARVFLDGRDLGLYVVKEGADKRFLRRAFADEGATLYDGGFLTDIDGELERDEGSGPDDRAALTAIVEAARDPDRARGRERLEALVDLESFFRFVALERMLGHWDGYANGTNNYRIVIRTSDGKAVFVPHGLDQLLMDDLGLYDDAASLLADRVLSDDVLRSRYRAAVRSALPLVADPRGMLATVDRSTPRLDAAFVAIGPEAAEAQRERVADLRRRIEERAARLRERADEPDPPLLAFDRGRADLGRSSDGWYEVREFGDAVFAAFALREPEGEPLQVLAITSGPSHGTRAWWRRAVVLPAGRYRFVARVRASDLGPGDPGAVGDALPEIGVRLRALGRECDAASAWVDAANDGWSTLSVPFEIAADRRSVELGVEFASGAGHAYVDRASVRVEREE